MKKLVSLLAVCLLLASFTVLAVVPASAATPYETIINSLKENVPANLLEGYLPMAENILKQLDITAEQAAGVVGCIETANAGVDDHHDSLSEFTTEERQLILEQINKAVAILELRYETKPSPKPQHDHDNVAIFYTNDGEKLAELDFDIKKTNVADEVNVEYVVAAVVLLAGAAVAFAYGKKVVASR